MKNSKVVRVRDGLDCRLDLELPVLALLGEKVLSQGEGEQALAKVEQHGMHLRLFLLNVEVGQRLGKLRHDTILCHLQRVGLVSDHGVFTVHGELRVLSLSLRRAGWAGWAKTRDE